MNREYEVLVTVKITATALHQTDAMRIASDKIGRAISALKAEVVATELK